MKGRTVIFTLVALAAVLALTLTPALGADKPKVIKLAHVAMPNPMESPFEAACYGFKEAVENLTAGRFEVKIYPGGTLGKELDLMEAVKTNQIQAHLATPGGLYRVFPPAYLYSTPFMFRNAAVGMAVVDGPFSEKILEAFTAKTGIKALGFIDLGTHAPYTNNVRPIRTPADVKGIKFRAMDQLQITMFKALGGSAVPIAWPEVYTSLQTGVVQGQMNPCFVINLAKLYEVQKYLTFIPSNFSPLLFVANKGWYDSLSPEDQRAMRVASIYGKFAARGLGLLVEGMALEALKKKGMEVTVIPESEIAEFAKIVQPKALEVLKSQMDAEWVDGLIKATQEAEAKLGY